MVIVKKAQENSECQKNISQLLESLHIEYNSVGQYILAFIHRSIVNEKPDFAPQHNERLEFLGDAVLELVVTEQLFKDFPEKTEGQLTDIRSALVRGKNLAHISKKLGFDKYLLLGNGEEMSGGRENEYILANTLEAFLGALYLEKGYDDAKNFVLQHIYATLGECHDDPSFFKDFKSLIQEYAQAELEITPTYKLLSEYGPDHEKVFEVGIFLQDKMVGVGTGSSKKKAQEDAAQNAYHSRYTW